nr:unnamed protein product [Callosobruchus chinensis]
MMKLYFEILLE